MKKITIDKIPPNSLIPNIKEVVILASDGYPLSGTVYTPTKLTKGSIIIAGAVGVPQTVYRRFSIYAAEKGFKVLTFDYRGINKSKQTDLKRSKISLMDWAKLDTASAINWIHNRGHSLYYVGHSFGGHSLGLIPNHKFITAAFSLGTGACWPGYFSKKESRKLKLLFNIVFPLIVFWKGYLALSMLNMGEDVPKEVYLNWKRWHKNRRHFF